MHQLAALQPDLLSRLDDSSNSVRVAACVALHSLLRSCLAAPGGMADSDAACLASSLLIHVEDPDAEVAAAAGAVLAQLMAASPGAVGPLVHASAGSPHAHAEVWASILSACGHQS